MGPRSRNPGTRQIIWVHLSFAPQSEVAINSNCHVEGNALIFSNVTHILQRDMAAEKFDEKHKPMWRTIETQINGLFFD